MSDVSQKKTLIINMALLTGVAALLFQVYLPTLEEILDQNQQLHQAQKQLKELSLYPASTQPVGKKTMYALPASEKERLSQELEILAKRHGLRLIQVEAHPEQAESLSLGQTLVTPYTIGLMAQDPEKLAGWWADLEQHFPELHIEKVSYEKEVATFEARLLTSSKSVRLFSP